MHRIFCVRLGVVFHPKHAAAASSTRINASDNPPPPSSTRGEARDVWQQEHLGNQAGETAPRAAWHAPSHLQGGSEGITQAVFRLRQASQGRFLRLRGCLARPNWLWMVNLRGRACWPWANGSAPLSMSCVTRAFHGERVVRRPALALAGLAGARVLRRTAGGDGEEDKQSRLA